MYIVQYTYIYIVIIVKSSLYILIIVNYSTMENPIFLHLYLNNITDIYSIKEPLKKHYFHYTLYHATSYSLFELKLFRCLKDK